MNQEQLLQELKEIKKQLFVLQNGVPPYLLLKDITHYFNIGKDSVYKYILPRAKARVMGRLKLYKTEEIIEIIDSYSEFIPDITWPI